MRLGSASGRYLGALLGALLGAMACGGGAPPIPEGLETVPHPELAGVEEVVRRQLEEARAELSGHLAAGRAEAAELAGAFGRLGELYHAYELTAPAAACYRNALTLDPESFRWTYQLGLLEQGSGALEAAETRFERSLELRPEHPPALLRLGEVRLASGEPSAAAEAFRELLAEGELAAAAHYGLGRALASSDPATAAGHFEKALELQPEAGIVRHALGLAYRRLGRLEEAERQLAHEGSAEVRVEDPLAERLEELAVSSGALLRRGNQALLAGRLETAVERFRDAVRADPQSVEARRNLALALVRRGEVDAAIAELEAALELAPENPWLHFDLGTAHLSRGGAEPAINALHRAVELAPELATARFNLGNALAQLDRWGEAREHLQKVVELEPGDGRARYLLAMAEHHAGDRRRSLEALEELLADDPASEVYRDGLATVYLESGRAGRAAEVYRRALGEELPPAIRLHALERLAALAWQGRQQEEAIDYYRRATELVPESSPAWSNLANALQLLGRRRQAIEGFERAVELDPANAEAWLSEGTLWILEGDFLRARQRLEEAASRVGEHPRILGTLARLLATSPDAAARDGRQAFALAQQAYALESSPEHAETVAMALAELGQFQRAADWQRSLIARMAEGGDRALLAQMAGRLRLYEQGKPMRIQPEP